MRVLEHEVAEQSLDEGLKLVLQGQRLGHFLQVLLLLLPKETSGPKLHQVSK